MFCLPSIVKSIRRKEVFHFIFLATVFYVVLHSGVVCEQCDLHFCVLPRSLSGQSPYSFLRITKPSFTLQNYLPLTNHSVVLALSTPNLVSRGLRVTSPRNQKSANRDLSSVRWSDCTYTIPCRRLDSSQF